MFEKMLLAVDRSDGSKKAIELAAGLAGSCGGEVLAVNVREIDVGRTGAFPMETTEEAQELLDTAVRRIKDAGGSARSEGRSALTGHAADEILEAAKAFDADLVILGSRGHGGVAGVFLGSVVTKVIHRSEQPVLVAR